ncbi:MAG TPA: type IV toxin-antitoxin system AbiEi family antitoxin domain-containing protein [Pseudonocardiaceae bacterium]
MLIEELAASRDGVLTRAEAMCGGLTLRQIQHRVHCGQWVKLHPGVYLVGRGEPDQRAALRAAVAWAGPCAVASGLTAAWWWGLRDWAPGAAEVTVPRGRSHRCPPDVVLRRRGLDPVDLVVVRGLPVTALPLTVLDAAAALGIDSAQPLVDRALQQRVSFAELHAAYCRSFGRHGSPWLGRVLRQAADGACSQAERVLHRLLRHARIEGWVANHKAIVAGAEYWLDIAVVARRLAIEVDGWAWHSTVDRFARDRRRQNALVLAGWTVLRFTWRDLTCRPEAVIAQIRAALRR